MFLQQSIKPENKFWKYISGSLIIILASVIGQMPMLIAVMYKLIMDGGNFENLQLDETTLMTTLDKNTSLFLLLFSFLIALVGVFFVVKYLHQQTLKSIITSRSKIDWSRVAFAFLLWAAITIIMTAADYYMSPNDYVFNFKLIPFLILLLIGVIMIPIQTSVEEFVFRGYLMQGFANLSYNKWFPLLMTSVIFGVMHIANPEVQKLGYVTMVYYIGTGLFLGILTLMDDGMELSLGFHAANNLIGALLVTTDWSVFKTHSILKDISEPNAGLDIVLPVIIIFPIILFIFSKKYGWTNWKEKLTGNLSRNQEKI